jgi:hypothetical protein
LKETLIDVYARNHAGDSASYTKGINEPIDSNQTYQDVDRWKIKRLAGLDILSFERERQLQINERAYRDTRTIRPSREETWKYINSTEVFTRRITWTTSRNIPIKPVIASLVAFQLTRKPVSDRNNPKAACTECPLVSLWLEIVTTLLTAETGSCQQPQR